MWNFSKLVYYETTFTEFVVEYNFALKTSQRKYIICILIFNENIRSYLARFRNTIYFRNIFP